MVNRDTILPVKLALNLIATVAAVKATQTLTSDATAPSNGETVVIDGVTYTAKTAIADPFDVLIGASAAAFLDNLKAAINGDAGEGTTYGTGTTAHPTVTATTNTDTTQVIEAQTEGAGGNDIAVSETSEHLSWGAATLEGGVTAVTQDLDVTAVGGEGGVARALIIDMPEINGVGATYTISVLDEEDSVVFVSEAQNEDAVSLVALTVPFMIMPTDKIKITPSALPSNVDCSVKIR